MLLSKLKHSQSHFDSLKQSENNVVRCAVWPHELKRINTPKTNRICSCHIFPILAADGHTNMKFSNSGQISPEPCSTGNLVPKHIRCCKNTIRWQPMNTRCKPNPTRCQKEYAKPYLKCIRWTHECYPKATRWLHDAVYTLQMLRI